MRIQDFRSPTTALTPPMTPRGTPSQPATRPARSARVVDSFEGQKSTATRNAELSIDGTNTDPADGGRPDFDQGNTNACGTTSLAIVLHRLGIEKPRAEIDRAIRNYDLYTPVNAIVGYARQQGLQAQVYNAGSFEQLQQDLAAGREIMVFTDVGGYDERLDLQPGSKRDLATHWMVVTGAYEKGGERFVSYMNPWGYRETLPYRQFDALWRDVHALGVPTGYDRTYVLFDHRADSSLRRSNAGELRAINLATGGVSNVANGWAAITRGEVLQGLGRIGKGVAESVVGGAGFALQTVGSLVSRGLTRVAQAAAGFFGRVFGR